MNFACPRCRGVRGGRFVVRELRADGADLACTDPACGARYATVEGVPVILRQPGETAADSALARRLAASYAEAWETPGWPHGPRDRLDALLARLEPGASALDLCCGTAHAAARLASRFEDVVALDAYLPLLSEGLARMAPSARARVRPVCADALDPPLFAERFELVLLFAAIDSVRCPRLLVGQADALLAPGGLLVMATPFAWDDAVTPAAERLSGPDELAAMLQGRARGLEHLCYDLVEEADDLAWDLRRDARTVTRFGVHWLVVKKTTLTGDPNGI